MENKDRPAFPVTKDMGYSDTGLTKREYFAGLAMQGVISACYSDLSIMHHISNPDEIEAQIGTCIDWADELLKQLKEQ